MLLKEGVTSEQATNVRPGVDRSLKIKDPEGKWIERFKRAEFLDDKEVIGIGPVKLGHVAFVVEDPRLTAEFYAQVLGFRASIGWRTSLYSCAAIQIIISHQANHQR